jgi:hypothetical protein
VSLGTIRSFFGSSKGGLSAGPNVKLFEDVVDMKLRRRFADEERPGDFLVG